jgi:OmpA-OmpF porin, OOP family
MKYFISLSFLLLMFLTTSGLKAQTEDAGGCIDHPMFNRIPDYRIDECMVKDTGTFSFPVESRNTVDVKKQVVEGKYSYYSYKVKEGAKDVPSLLILRDLDYRLAENYGSIVARVVEPGNSSSFITGKVAKDNMDTWILIRAEGNGYQLNIVEKQRKVQVIRADSMWNTLDKKDSITLDIFFDDDTITIIPASLPVVDQIYDLLVNHPDLKLSIQCHTDNRRPPIDNKIKSAMRAKVVLDALTAKGISKTRLSSIGWGQDKPVADNKTADGRAKNRRVVIVKKQE